jgi:hypothetical protein
MPAEKKLLLVAYPQTPNKMFEDVMMRLRPTLGWRFDRFRSIDDIIAITRSESQGGTIAVTQLDLFAHGRPGVFGLDSERLFDAFESSCTLRGVAKHLAPNAVVRLLGCHVAGPEDRSRGAWKYDPLAALTWLSGQLGGRKVEAPIVAIGAGSFEEDGFGQPPAGVMLAAQRKPTP